MNNETMNWDKLERTLIKALPITSKFATPIALTEDEIKALLELIRKGREMPDIQTWRTAAANALAAALECSYMNDLLLTTSGQRLQTLLYGPERTPMNSSSRVNCIWKEQEGPPAKPKYLVPESESAKAARFADDLGLSYGLAKGILNVDLVEYALTPEDRTRLRELLFPGEQ